MVDEKALRFSYKRFDASHVIRALEYAPDANADSQAKWTRVEGEPEPWEAIMFSPRRMEQYRKHVTDELRAVGVDNTIKAGLSVPWPCDLELVAELARTLQLPWDPINNRFPPAAQTEVIPGNP